MTEMKIGIQGLAEFSRALNKFDKDSAKMIRLANNSSADLLIGKVRPLIPRVSGNAANSLKARSTRTSARIQVGGSKARYYPWLDFGGQGKRSGRPASRPFYKEGRYIYPTLRKYRDEIMELHYHALRDVAREAGLEVT